jgi:hypothetical protein
MVMKRVFVLMAFSIFFHYSKLSAMGWNFDILSVEAVIKESKSAGSMNLSRAAIEVYNRGLHKESNEKAIDYEKIEKRLDKYRRCMDYIDVLYTGASTVGQFIRTYDTVKESIKEYRTLLKEYGDYIVRTGRISTADAYIIKNCEETINQAVEDSKDVYGTLTMIGAFCSGKLPCKAEDLQLVLAGLNLNLQQLGNNLMAGSERLRSYMLLRTWGWGKGLYKARPTSEICDEALSRWKSKAIGVMSGRDIEYSRGKENPFAASYENHSPWNN